MDIRKITDELSVAPQILAAEVPAIAAAGFRAVVCNRPDGESSDQPCCSDIEAAVKAHGLVWRSQPVRSGAVTFARPCRSAAATSISCEARRTSATMS